MGDQFRTSEEVEVDLRAVFGAIGRRLPILIVIALVVGAGVFVLLSLVEPRYRAETTVLIETGESEITRDEALTATLLDREGIASQVELIRSRGIALAVIEQLELAVNTEFDPSQRPLSLISRVLGWLGLGGDQSSLPADELVVAEFRDRLSVNPIDRTRVISIGFVSTDSQLAADVTNAVAEQYIALQRDVRRDTTANATEWLQGEIEALSERVVAAEAAVEAFRADADLFLAGVTDVTLASQRLADLSSELSRVEAARTQAESTADLIRANLSSNATLTSVDALNSTLIRRLREEEVLLRAAIAEASATFLPGHPRMRELSAQLADLEAAIRIEAGNVLTGLENEAALALGYENEISQQLAELKAIAAASNQAEVELRALERVANAERELLETYLGLARESVSRQNADYLPVNARVVSLAAAPIEPFSPKTVSLTAIAMIITMMLGAAFLLVRELANGRATNALEPAFPVVADATPADGRVRWADDIDVRRMMPFDPNSESDIATRIEESLFAVAAKLRQAKGRRILITMAAGGGEQGRPMAAVALARALARTGARVLLVDLHADGANRLAMGGTETFSGFGDLMAEAASFSQVIFRDRSSPAHFIPGGGEENFADRTRFDELTTALEQTYDHVVYDVSDASLPLLASGAAAAVVVTDFEHSDPRTVRACEAIMELSEAEILVLLTDPLPAESSRGAAAYETADRRFRNRVNAS